jgi:hypothetical protein
VRTECRECGGSSICKHKKLKQQCKECVGTSICEHNRIKSKCKECGGGSICKHNRMKTLCLECGGGSFCKHNKRKSRCSECDEIGYIKYIVSSRIRAALKNEKNERSITYLGCTIVEFKKHIESKWEEGMSWENHGQGEGTWQIDHIVPVKYGDNVTLEEYKKRLHWTNTQPLWTSQNLSKGNRFIG